MWRYLIWLVAIITLVIILIILILPGGKKQATPAPLYSYANTNSVAKLSIIGPITNEETHVSLSISVSSSAVAYDQFVGYDGKDVNHRTYPSSYNTYNVFLHAIYYGGFALGDKNSKYADNSGYCPLGDQYVFEFSQNNSDIERFWTSTCGNPRTFNGNTSLILQLFENQVPDYNMLTSNLNF